jgi:vancomycin resistance protein VanW
MKLLLRLLPAQLKLMLRVQWRHLQDAAVTGRKGFASVQQNTGTMPFTISLQQSIKTNDTASGKVQNISIALTRINNLVIQPGQVFSFWRLVGNPTAKKGYQKSRSIVRGELVTETGGGLCQLSGLIYFLAIKAGLQITERHAHSMDIYTEAERFTPLGSDATVAYGYKDLRFVNTLPHPVQLQFALAAGTLTGSIISEMPVTDTAITFLCKTEKNTVEVITMAGNNELCKNSYQRMNRQC